MVSKRSDHIENRKDQKKNGQASLDGGPSLNGAEKAKPLVLGEVDHQANLLRTPRLSIPGQDHPLKESEVLGLNLFLLAQYSRSASQIGYSKAFVDPGVVYLEYQGQACATS